MFQMSIFNKAIDDIFNCKDFLENCTIGQTVYDCICSAIEDGVVYGDIGSVDDVDFTLSIKLPLERIPSRGDKVMFRNKNYKISNVTYDSANASIKLHLMSVSKG